MQFDKSTIIQFLEQRGQHDQAQQAQQQLPQQVDHQQHSGLLQSLGINPDDLVKNLGSQAAGDALKKL